MISCGDRWMVDDGGCGERRKVQQSSTGDGACWKEKMGGVWRWMDPCDLLMDD